MSEAAPAKALADAPRAKDSAVTSRAGSVLLRAAEGAARGDLTRKLAFLLTGLAILAGGLTYWALQDGFGGTLDAANLLLILYIDFAIVLLLAAVIAWRVIQLWLERREGAAGSRLILRLVAMFSAVAVAPAILLAIFSALFLNIGLESWFGDRVSNAISGARQVAESYLDEHRRNIRADALSMAVSLSRDGRLAVSHPRLMRRIVAQLAQERNFSEASVFRGDGEPLARAGFNFALGVDSNIPEDAMARARLGEIVLLDDEESSRVRALLKVPRFVDTFMLVTRLVDPRVLGAIERTSGAADEFAAMEGRRDQIQLTFGLVYALVALLLLLAAVWTGLTLATSLSRPVVQLIGAARRVGEGDFTARVEIDERAPGDEIGQLSEGFNAMTGRLEHQQGELIDAYEQLDKRRIFMETVLAGVAAGVIGLDAQGRVRIANRFALERLSLQAASLHGRQIEEVAPAFGPVVADAQARPDRAAEAEIRLTLGDGSIEMLIARVEAESSGEGYVLTFSDVSELVDAQRKAAWADVARRIAHEIKNPLTPIQLSAERLKRKYLKHIETDPEVFETCVDTIVRHVDDIGRMVSEFSAFARMPQPRIAPTDLVDISRNAMTLQRGAHGEISFTFDGPETPAVALCDPRLIEQALTNLLLNAAQAVEARWARTGVREGGAVSLRLRAENRRIAVAVEDDGCGLPQAEERARLTEPYVTTREKGTGLGLAIVKKVIEEHGGGLKLGDRAGGGAVVSLWLPAAEADARLASGRAA